MNPHKYRDLPIDQQEELFSNFLLDSWSYSKVSTFARNEKAFEMSYIYRQPYRRSATEVAGLAYHEALKFYFLEYKKNIKTDVASLQVIAYNYIDAIPANSWKKQKTTPTIEECKQKATDTVNKLLNNFFSDIQVYLSELKEVIDVEMYMNEFITVNGVDIPLPCHAVTDLLIKTNDNKVVVIDHKSKTAFSDEKDVKFIIGKQAITYVLCFEQMNKLIVDEVWFIENKPSANKDKSPQVICHKVPMDKDNRRLYEAMLYEPLKRMLEAISNPDHVYLINDNDSFVDKAEMYEFWAQTMIAEIDDFNIPENKKELVAQRLKKVRDTSLGMIDPKTIKKFRENASEFIQYDLTNKNMTKPEKIEHTLRTLNLMVNVVHTFSGYSSDTFLLEVSAGTNIATIQRYKLDIASALNVASIRMNKDLFVYNKKSYVCIEASKIRDTNLMFDPSYLEGNKIPLGLDNFNQKVVWDIDNPSTPHILVGGSTGSGKTIFLISTIEYAKQIGFDNIVLFDPKFEFKRFVSSKISVYNDIEEIETVMELLVEEMNALVKKGAYKRTLIVFDEFADAVASSRKGKDLNVYEDVCIGNYKDGSPKMKREISGTKKALEENLRILLQKGRSSGYRIIAATQRASVKVITGDSKVNFGIKICFRVPKTVDSVVILDEEGAESLSGKGDGLLSSPEYSGIIRFQAFYKG